MTNSTILSDGRNVCGDCADGDCFDCDECNDAAILDAITLADGDTLCADCFRNLGYNCDNCDEPSRRADMHALANGDEYCDACLNDYCGTCESCCGAFNRADESYIIDRCGVTFCESCAEELYYCEYCDEYSTSRRCCGEALSDYCVGERGDSLALGFKNLGDDDTNVQLHLGAEIEVSYDGDDAQFDANELTSILGHKLFTYVADGSLNNGVEVNSAPMTLDFWQTSDVRETMRVFYREFSNMNLSHSRAGFHVHASRAGIRQQSIEVATTLIYGDAEFRHFAEWLSRRNGSYGYCRFDLENQYYGVTKASKTPREWRKVAKEIAIDGTTAASGREKFQALNLLPRDTVEFRLFKTPSTSVELCEGLEFVECLLTYGNHSTADDASLLGFIEWAIAGNGRYDNLVKAIERYLSTATIKQLDANRAATIESKSEDDGANAAPSNPQLGGAVIYAREMATNACTRDGHLRDESWQRVQVPGFNGENGSDMLGAGYFFNRVALLYLASRLGRIAEDQHQILYMGITQLDACWSMAEQGEYWATR